MYIYIRFFFKNRYMIVMINKKAFGFFCFLGWSMGYGGKTMGGGGVGERKGEL